jgi:hypothetical protein
MRAFAMSQKCDLPKSGGRYLGSTTPSVASHWIDPFVHRLREFGWIELVLEPVSYRPRVAARTE